MQKQQQENIEDSGFAPSFSCYSSDHSMTSMAVAKVISEEKDVGDVDFEFSIVLKQNLVENDEVDNKIKSMNHKIDASIATVPSSLGKLFIDEREEYFSNSSSETDESDPNSGSSPLTSKFKKSSSAGSGSKHWIFRYLLRKTNIEGKQPTVLLTPKMVVDSPKHKRNSGEVLKTGGRWKAQTPVHEQFYVQRRAENEVEKRKSYLPYRKDLVGFFVNVNGMGKILPF